MKQESGGGKPGPDFCIRTSRKHLYLSAAKDIGKYQPNRLPGHDSVVPHLAGSSEISKLETPQAQKEPGASCWLLMQTLEG